MANNLKQLDANQVIRSAYDPVENRLRVDAQISGSIGEIDVNIDHTEDSVRLGDGTNFLTSTSVASDVGLDVNVINTSLPISLDSPGTPRITNISIPLANTEQSHVLVTGAKKILLRIRGIGKLQYSFTSGQSGTNFITIKKGNSESIDGIDLTSSTTIYFQNSRAGETLEILEWS